MKLWQKRYDLSKEVEDYTVGKDFILDMNLLKYDCIASIGHAKMLCKIGIIEQDELNKIVGSLNKIMQLHAKGDFIIEKCDEDCHTAIEKFLVQDIGDIGKKIHTARSRNDQVLSALRLYEIDELNEIISLIISLKIKLEDISKAHNGIEMPGYTHTQKAMPTTISMWIDCYIEAITDDIELLKTTKKFIDKCPLGTGAGFGIPIFDIDRLYVANEIGFLGMIKNPIYAQHSRGKYESLVINTLVQIMYDLNKFASDLILFSTKEFGYIELPQEFCTGSSIMPQKKNPDVLELVRANYHIILGEELKVKSLISNLISGYNRDLQLTKEPMMNCFDIAKSTISIMNHINFKVNSKNCAHAMTPELYATEKAYKLVKNGTPFREAYKIVSEEYQ